MISNQKERCPASSTDDVSERFMSYSAIANGFLALDHIIKFKRTKILLRQEGNNNDVKKHKLSLPLKSSKTNLTLQQQI